MVRPAASAAIFDGPEIPARRNCDAVGSLNEIDTQLELALRFGYVTEGDYDCLYKLLNECLALTYGLKKSVNGKQ